MFTRRQELPHPSSLVCFPDVAFKLQMIFRDRHVDKNAPLLRAYFPFEIRSLVAKRVVLQSLAPIVFYVQISKLKLSMGYVFYIIIGECD